MKSNSRIFILLIVLIIAITAFSYVTLSYSVKVKLSSVEEANVKKLSNVMKTHCVGRYLIDLPESFLVKNGFSSLNENHWVANIQWPDNVHNAYITTKKMYYPAFEQMLKMRETEITNTKAVDSANMPFLKKAWPLSAEMKGVIFERNSDESTNDAIRVLEGYFYTNGVAIKLQKETVDDSSPRYEADRKRRGKMTNYVIKDLERINNLFSRMNGREENVIPNEPGSCIANAFISFDNKIDEKENVSFLFSSDDLVGMTLTIGTDNYTAEENSLLDRESDVMQAASLIQAEILKKGKREVNDIKAEEVLFSFKSLNNDNPVYLFELFANEKNGSNRTPFLNVSLKNDDESDTPYSGYNENEVVSIWDVIIESIRIR